MEHNNPYRLPDKLYYYPHDDNGFNNIPQPEQEAEYKCQSANDKQRSIRKMAGRVQFGEDRKKLAIGRRRIWYALIPKQG